MAFSTPPGPDVSWCACLELGFRRLALHGLRALAHLLAPVPEDAEDRIADLGLTLDYQWKLSGQLEELFPALVGSLDALLVARFERVLASFPSAGALDELLGLMLHRTAVDERPFVSLDGGRVAACLPSGIVARAGDPSTVMRDCLMVWASSSRAGANPAARKQAVQVEVDAFREDGYHFTRDDLARVWAAIEVLEGAPSPEWALVTTLSSRDRPSPRIRGLFLLASQRWEVSTDGVYHVLRVPAGSVSAFTDRSGTSLSLPSEVSPAVLAGAAEIFLNLWDGRDLSAAHVWEAAQACMA